MDSRHSMFTVHVYKAGLFSVFAHDHTITAPIARGEIDDAEHSSVELWVDSSALRVADPDLSAKDRAEVQKTMEGPQVLDVARYPQIHFRSTAVQPVNPNRWTVRGVLDLHGKSLPVAVEVAASDGSYVGSATLKQRDYGIRPIRVAGGTVSVKDAVQIEFKVFVAPAPRLGAELPQGSEWAHKVIGGMDAVRDLRPARRRSQKTKGRSWKSTAPLFASFEEIR